MMVQIHGFSEERFNLVKEAFIKNFEREKEIGASVAVMEKGKMVVDLWAGYIDKEHKKPWEKDTIINIYSTTKIMTALCLHILIDRGLADLDDPVSKHWPEFGQNGKEKVLIRHILSHTSGLPGFDEKIPLEALYDWERMTSMLASQRVRWEPGTRSGYQMISFGYLVGNMVKKISGKSLGTFFKEEISDPLDIDFHIGFGSELDERVGDLFYKKIPKWQKYLISIIKPKVANVVFNPDPNELLKQTMLRKWRIAEIPSSNGHGNARSIAKIGSILACGGTFEGKKILSSSTIEDSIQSQIINRDKTNMVKTNFGQGWQLNPKMITIGPKTFSWGGYGGSLCVMEREKEVCIAYAMNKIASTLSKDTRAINLVKALKKVLK